MYTHRSARLKVGVDMESGVRETEVAKFGVKLV